MKNDIDPKIAAQIAGLTDYRTDEPLDRPPTLEERRLAVDVGFEIAERVGINLQEYIDGQEKSEREYARKTGLK